MSEGYFILAGFLLWACSRFNRCEVQLLLKLLVLALWSFVGDHKYQAPETAWWGNE